MIPGAAITQWRVKAPWADDAQVEQDLVLSRALVELFDRPRFAEQALFRGGTALHKVYFDPPGRYSEDIDLVQRESGAIGPLVTEIRSALDNWLGEPTRKVGPGCFTLSYRFTSTREPITPMRLKIEINTREHFALYGIAEQPFNVASSWFTGQTTLLTYTLPELLGTKLRALYQRKKGRDLFDLATAIEAEKCDPGSTIAAFTEYLKAEEIRITRAQFEANMRQKMQDPAFTGDITPLLRTGLDFDPVRAWRLVHKHLISRMPGEPWKGEK